jgi:hypothetical protein
LSYALLQRFHDVGGENMKKIQYIAAACVLLLLGLIVFNAFGGKDGICP